MRTKAEIEEKIKEFEEQKLYLTDLRRDLNSQGKILIVDKNITFLDRQIGLLKWVIER